MVTRLLLLLVVLLLPSAPQVHAADSTPDRQQLMQEASELFREANQVAPSDADQARELYEKSLLRYRKLAEAGGNGKLYYNIGNTYFRLHDLGRAILNYRRAQLYLPDDENLRQNLAFVESRRVDRIERKEKEKVLETLFFFHYDLPLPVRVTIVVVAASLFWLLLIGRLLTPLISIWLPAVSLTIVLLFVGSVAFDSFYPPPSPGVIVAPEVTARKGDGVNFSPSFTEPLHAGTDFTLVEDRGSWRHIELADGRRCWVEAFAIDLVSEGS
ncbi:MAG: tetratricopeptide repeat protein [Proteobacteria bacterium]|nr:tetratricopeptide repeat protein [Pseudomonadota bacterium]MBU1688131.1 tetratricopeptide repeat protein [Pseudomonadota bacterium]